MKEVSSVQVTE